jgi:threonine dehydrogenase-like Zn-dependent dehydrogenase
MAAVASVRAPTATMDAAVLVAPRVCRVERVRRPEPGRGHVRVRIDGCGVCGSSLPLWEGRPWFSYPLEPGAPGHEGWGIVEAAGPEVEGALIGRRVALLSQHALAQYDVAAADDVVLLPTQLDGLPFPGEALGCVVNAFGRSDVGPGQTVAIVGMGFFGSAFAQLARAAGAEVVEVRRGTDSSAWHERCERVLEAAGTQEALDSASELVAPRGRLVIAGFHQDGRRTIDLQSWNWRGIDVVNAHERDRRVCVEGMREAARLAAAGTLDVEALATHRFPLERAGDAFAAAARREPGFVKAWVAP